MGSRQLQIKSHHLQDFYIFLNVKTKLENKRKIFLFSFSCWLHIQRKVYQGKKKQNQGNSILQNVTYKKQSLYLSMRWNSEVAFTPNLIFPKPFKLKNKMSWPNMGIRKRYTFSLLSWVNWIVICAYFYVLWSHTQNW